MQSLFLNEQYNAKKNTLTGGILKSPYTANRIEVIDVLRGLVMILMALDHTRDFFTNTYLPLDMHTTSAVLFFTRWITHFCAPVFIFLVGTSMAVAIASGKPKKQIAEFLITRGIWMLIIEIAVINLLWFFDYPNPLYLQVIWVLGLGMIMLAGLIFLPNWLILTIGLTVVLGHNLLDGKEAMLLGSWQWLHMSAEIDLPDFMLLNFFVFYPPIPWIVLPGLGYVFGSVFSIDKASRTKFLFALGLFCIFAFLVIRYLNFYGDPHPWVLQYSNVLTLLSFLNVSKYPPSLDYLLMTLGPIFLLLILLERVHNRFTNILAVFGKVAFFYYIMHMFLIHALSWIVGYYRLGLPSAAIANDTAKYMAIYGFSLPVVYLLWLLILVMLYPLCKWYMNLKRRNKTNVLFSYI